MELKEVIHSATAQICRDISSADRELTYPPQRRWARLVVIAVVWALLVAAIVLVAVRIPEFQTQKTVFSRSEHPTADLQNLLDVAVKKNESITCSPCRYQFHTWMELITFHVYIAAVDEHAFSEVLTITKKQFNEIYSKLCGSDSESLATAICESVLSSVFNSDDSRTSLQTAANAFTSPDLLYTDIQIRINGNVNEVANTYKYLHEINKTAYFNYTDGLAQLLLKMADQFVLNSSSTPEDFWNAGEIIRKNNSDVVGTIGFGMDVNWTTYVQKCNAAFCDVEYKVSVVNRMLRAMGQVGGITTVISLALKFLVWPSLRMALGFPTYNKVPAASDAS